MGSAVKLLAGAGMGAGLMYILDPQMGRRRRALARDKMTRLAHEAQEMGDVVVRDVQNRAQGLAAGDFSVLAGGRRALRNPLRGRWSPSARALMAVLGGGLFLYGLTRSAPKACILGTAGLALAAEGITNAAIDDITGMSQEVAGAATNIAGRMADQLGFGERTQEAGRQQRTTQPAGAGR
jgi:hypothetical protein